MGGWYFVIYLALNTLTGVQDGRGGGLPPDRRKTA